MTAPAVPQPASEATPELTSRPVDREALPTREQIAEAQVEWHFAYLGMEYRHPGRKEDCDLCVNWELPTTPAEVPSD